MRSIKFHTGLFYVITAITGFVLALLLIVMVRFNARANPTPSRTTHNTLVEVLWTLIPVAILVGIAVPSFRLLFYQLNVPAADLTVKATGKQWYWSYSYPDNGKFEFDSLLVRDEKKLKPDQPRLLGVDTRWWCGQQDGPRVDHRRRSSIPLRCPRSASRSTPFPAASTRPGSRPRAKASITANAPNCAARTTPSCRSR